MNKPNKIIVHHTGGSDANPLSDSSNFTFKQCDELHKQKFNFKSSLGFYCGYHYYIEKDGKMYQARADSDEGAHTIGQNTTSIGICLAGNFDATLPTEAQITTLRNLLRLKTNEFKIPAKNVFPHRAFASKTCYGNKLSGDWAQKLLDTPVAGPTKDTLIQQAIELLTQAKNLA